MSTEAPRSPIPPRPTTPPPRPISPPAPTDRPRAEQPAPDQAFADKAAADQTFAGKAAADPSDEAAEPPPVPSARFPDVRPPVDRDWVLDSPRPAALDDDEDPAQAARIQDLLAPFEQARATAPPPPASARLPDTPPPVADDSGACEGRSPLAAAAPRTAPTGTTAARRAAGAVDPAPGPGAGRPFVFFARPGLYDDSTARPRPVGAWARPRAAAAVACVVLGLGLIGGAVTGSWLTGESAAGGATRSAYTVTGGLWHSVPVDRLFPPALEGEGAGPGGADRAWTRIAVAPDSNCADAFDPLLRKALAPVGCLRLLRATYTDATRSHVTTVGLLFTKADADGMQTLRNRFTEEGLDRRPDLMPRPYAAKGTAADGFGDTQRASWTMSVLPDAPVVAYAVSGFADGRVVTDPEPATEAMGTNTTSAPAQSGLGHEAKGIADRVERGLRKTIAAAEKKS
ncbi:hypothetical protein [Streptomyces sp. NPDC058308]|uniref:hypothetical protein n=1 Tax=Streptomyces sp. NPDC058308 TaxID=3346440 RepID=UPI0036F058C7